MLGMKKLLKTKFSKVNTKENNLEKVGKATSLIDINQNSKDKQCFEKRNEDVNKNIQDVRGLVTTTVLNTKINKVDNKIPVLSGLVTTAVLNTSCSLKKLIKKYQMLVV